jgi:radical SAM superfamily enzyme YgiQ (UPF0313 family)
MKILLSSICLESGTDVQLALYYLKAYLLQQQKGSSVSSRVRVEVFNENLSVAAMVSRIRRFSPGLVGFSCYLWNIEKTLRLCRALKKISPGITIVLGGPEVSPRATEVLTKEPAVDVIVRGEGEVTFSELAAQMEADIPELSGIKGISFRQEEKVVHTGDRPQLSSLDNVPSPYLSGLINLDAKNIVDVPLETTRGCAFRCHYCYYHKNFPLVRYFSLGRVERELKMILAHKPYELYLMDATFNSHPQRAKKILRMVIKHNKCSKLHVELKAELIDAEMARLLYKANAFNIEIGLQSTNPATLRAINRTFDREKFSSGIKLLNKYKLYYVIQLIDALPFQAYEDLLGSLDWLYSLRPPTVEILRLTMLPGTTLRARAPRYGIAYGKDAPYNARSSAVMRAGDYAKVERLRFAMERLYNSGLHQELLHALCFRTGMRVSEVFEEWMRWERGFKRRGYAYVEVLSRKMPDFLRSVCRRRGVPEAYKALVSSV